MKGPYVLIKSDGLDAINASLMSAVVSICTILYMDLSVIRC